MSASDWLILTIICFLGAASPGPSLGVILYATRIGGRISGITAAIGHGIGIGLYAFIAVTGLSYIITHHTTLFFALQIAGALLLLLLGGRLLMSSFRIKNKNTRATQTIGITNNFLSGFGIAAFNPKIAAFFASIFSQFFNEDQSLSIHLGMVMLAGIIDLLTYIFIVIAVSNSWVEKLIDGRRHLADRSLGGLIVIIALSLLITQLFVN